MALKTIADVGEDIAELIEALPKETKKFMKSEAKIARKFIRAYAKSKVKKLTGNYLKGFKAGKKVYEWSDAEYNIRVYNSAPHAHLIEDGHRIVVAGKTLGFVPGRHVMEEANKRFEAEFLDHVENNLADFIAKELDK